MKMTPSFQAHLRFRHPGHGSAAQGGTASIPVTVTGQATSTERLGLVTGLPLGVTSTVGPVVRNGSHRPQP